MKMNIGIIGYGGFGRFLHRSWSALGDVEVVAVADPNLADPPADAHAYAEVEGLLRDARVEIVSIATPPSSHADLATRAMRAGKHVLVEKPLAVDLAGAHQIRRVQQETGRTVAVDFMLRYNPIVEAMQAWSRRKPFGALRRVVVENYAQDETLQIDHWFWDRGVSGGILVEHAVHFIDIVNGCTDHDVVHVEGMGIRRNPRQEDRVMATMVYGDGLVASHFHSFARPTFFEATSLRFVFDLAQVDVQGWIPMEGSITSLISDATEAELQRLPNLLIQKRCPIPGSGGGVQSGGRWYPVAEEVSATFSINSSKQQEYAREVQALLVDMVAAIANPHHPMRVTLDDATKGLDAALQAAAGSFHAEPLDRNV